MSLKSKPYFWLECDTCGAKSTEDGDYSAWEDHGAAADEAYDRDWLSLDGKDYCDLCRPDLCAACHMARDEAESLTEDHRCPDCVEDNSPIRPWLGVRRTADGKIMHVIPHPNLIGHYTAPLFERLHRNHPTEPWQEGWPENG
jgi:hypothetical protein